MSGGCRRCFRSLGAFYGSDLCPRCEERAEAEQEFVENLPRDQLEAYEAGELYVFEGDDGFETVRVQT